MLLSKIKPCTSREGFQESKSLREGFLPLRGAHEGAPSPASKPLASRAASAWSELARRGQGRGRPQAASRPRIQASLRSGRYERLDGKSGGGGGAWGGGGG